jgi:hypothetical protein
MRLDRRALAALAACGGLSVLAACSGATDASTEESAESVSDAKSSFPPALSSADFTETLDRATLRATAPELSDADFAVKWTAALDDAFSFYRSFPAAYYQDLGTIAASRVPGAETVCAGDPHPDNFGWLDEGGVFFGLNDFDDSGDCPVAFDALRFLAGTELDFGSSKLTADALASYVASVTSGKPDTKVDSSLAPSFSKATKKTLAADVDGSSFVLSSDTKLSTLDDDTRAAALAWFAQEPRLAGATVLDLAAYDHASGGSAELPRVWLLLDRDGTQDILELKTEVEPGVEWGRHTHVVEGATRMSVLEGVYWPTTPADDSFLVTFGGSTWLARSRLARIDTGIDSLKSKDQKNELLAAASQLGVAHAAAWKGVSSKNLTAWLSASADVVAARWKAARKADN